MKTQTLKFALLLGLCSGATSLSAQMPFLFEEIDSDHDGAISMEESRVRSDLHADFARVDKDGNGTLSVDEYSTYMNEGKMAPEDVEIPEPGAAPVM